MQNPSELAAVVSFRDDGIKWGRIEVRFGGWEVCQGFRVGFYSIPFVFITDTFTGKSSCASAIWDGFIGKKVIVNLVSHRGIVTGNVGNGESGNMFL